MDNQNSNPYALWIAVTVVLLAVVEVLDITIVSVALKTMQGALSTSPNDITWTITVYGVSAAICMPLTGFLSKRFGRKKLLIISTVGFGLASLLCGLSHSLFQIILFRGLQGAAGALLPSLAQATLLDTFKGASRNKAMAFFGMGMMLGPIMGPLLGGYITENIGWRWIFFINLPLCVLGIMMARAFLTETLTEATKIDWLGLGLLAWAVGLLQLIVDKGNTLGWLSSPEIQWLIVIDGLGWLGFISWGISCAYPIVNFKIFKDKNFTLACLIMLIYYGVMLGSYAWTPLWLEIFMGYPASLAGLMLAPRGLACLSVMMLTPLLLKYGDARLWVMVASMLYGVGAYFLMHLNLQADEWNIMLPNIIQGFATGFFFVPLTLMAYQSLPAQYLSEASGIYNFSRNLGGSLGVALFSTVMSHMSQVSWHDMSLWIAPNHIAFQHWLQVQSFTVHTPEAYAQLGQTLVSQSNMIALNDGNMLFGLLALLLIPLVSLMDRAKTQGSFNILEA